MLFMKAEHGRVPNDLHWLAKQLRTSPQDVQTLYVPESRVPQQQRCTGMHSAPASWRVL